MQGLTPQQIWVFLSREFETVAAKSMHIYKTDTWNHNMLQSHQINVILQHNF